LSFRSVLNQLFKLQTNNDYLVKWGRHYQYFCLYYHVDYLRSTSEIRSYYYEHNCTSTLEVLAYVMNKINETNSMSII